MEKEIFILLNLYPAAAKYAKQQIVETSSGARAGCSSSALDIAFPTRLFCSSIRPTAASTQINYIGASCCNLINLGCYTDRLN